MKFNSVWDNREILPNCCPNGESARFWLVESKLIFPDIILDLTNRATKSIVIYLAIYHYLIVMIKISIYHPYVDSILRTAILLLEGMPYNNIAWLAFEIVKTVNLLHDLEGADSLG